MSRIVFGTDGWRAIIAEDFTFANVERVAQAAAGFWAAHPPPGTRPAVIVGYDRRFLSDQFAQRVAEVLLGNGFAVTLTAQPTPTPAVSLAVKRRRAVGGIMVTASHNPPEFNGLKLKACHGGPADGELCRMVEDLLDRKPVRRIALADALAAGQGRRSNLGAAHLALLRRKVDLARISHARLRVAHDAMFGVGAGCFESLLRGTRCQVTNLNARHDPLFGGINPEPVERNCHLSQAFLRQHPQDICLVTDGDSDRIGALEGRGAYVSANEIICLLLHHLIVHRHAKGRIVKVLNTTSMMDRIAAHYGLPLTEVGVGFKYTCAEMLKGDVLMGGEESGSLGFGGHIPERDGLLAGLYLLELLATERASVRTLLTRLEKQFGPHHYVRLDLRYPVDERPALLEFCRQNPPLRLGRSPVTRVQAFDGVKYTAQNGAWLMLRGSGTEPILRIYAEASTRAAALALLRQGERMRQPR